MNTNHNFTQYDFPADISKEELEQLPRATFSGHIVLIDNEHRANEAVKALSKEKILGVDTETKPNFVPGKRRPVSLIQISTEDTCYLFRLKQASIMKCLIPLLENPNILKIGLSLSDDLVGLRHVMPFEPQGFVELQKLAPAYGIRSASLQKLYAILYGVCMSKKQQMSNWEAPMLNYAQQHYAALDAYASLAIYNKLMAAPQPAPTQFGIIYL